MSLQLGEKHFSSAQPESAARRIVTFKVGDRTFGIDVGMVREIKGWQATTPLPHAAPHGCGRRVSGGGRPAGQPKSGAENRRMCEHLGKRL